MKFLTIFLACLLLAAVFNFALDVSRRAQFRPLVALLAQAAPSVSADQAFDRQLAATTDPDALRRLARAQRAGHAEIYRFSEVILRYAARMNALATVRSAVLLALAFCALLAALSAGRPRSGQD